MSFAEYRSGSSHKKSNAPPSALRLVTSESSGLYRGKRITTTSGLLRRPIAIGFPVAFTLSTISRKRLRAFVVVNIFMHLLYKTYKIVQACVRRLNLRSLEKLKLWVFPRIHRYTENIRSEFLFELRIFRFIRALPWIFIEFHVLYVVRLVIGLFLADYGNSSARNVDVFYVSRGFKNSTLPIF